MINLRPFWNYYGGKFRIAPRYPAPLHDTIVEPFAGAAGYSLRHHTRNVVLVDTYDAITELWRYLIGASSSDILGIPIVGAVADLPTSTCEGARLLVAWNMNSASAAPCTRESAGVKRQRATGRTMAGWSEARRARCAEQVSHIKHWRVVKGHYADIPPIQATWFVDPPYNNSAGGYYKHSAKAIDFGALGAWCQRLPGQVIVCENEGATWLPFRPFLDANGMHGVSREVVWTRP